MTYRIIVAKDAFSEDSPDQKPLSRISRRVACVCRKTNRCGPIRRHLAWHRKHKFLRGGLISRGPAS